MNCGMKPEPEWRGGLVSEPRKGKWQTEWGYQCLPGPSKEGFVEHQTCHAEHYGRKDMSPICPSSRRLCRECILLQGVHVTHPASQTQQRHPSAWGYCHGGGCVDVGSTGVQEMSPPSAECRWEHRTSLKHELCLKGKRKNN